MRRLVPLLALAVLLGPGPARAWNDEGHELVGALAERRLGSEARALVRELLGDGHLSDHDVAVWADDHRTRANAPNHWVDIPFEAGRYDAARDCPEGLCAVACIERAAEVLARDDDPGRRLEALRWLVHVVGDLHQPLHAAQGWRQGNLGGVRLPARAGSPPFDTNLHVVWDAVVVWPILAGRPPTEAAAALDAALDEASRRAWTADRSPAGWAGESNRLARAVYQELGATPTRTERLVVPEDYASRQRARVEAALGKAGLRLAALLDRIALERLRLAPPAGSAARAAPSAPRAAPRSP